MKHHRRLKLREMLRRATVLSIRPGDLVVLQLPREPNVEQAHQMRAAILGTGALTDAKVLVVGPGTSLKVIREQQRPTGDAS